MLLRRDQGASGVGSGLLLATVLLPACQAADPPAREECGNGIIEPSAGEDCEPVGDAVACGAVGSGAGACRFVCTEQSCPTGYRCGVDAICRRPCLGYEGEPACNAFETLSTDVTTDPVAQVSVVNVVGDARPEIIAVEYVEGDPTEAVVRVYALDGEQMVAGAPAPVGEFPTLTRLDAGSAVYLIAQRTTLPPAPATATVSERQALVSVLEPDLSFREVLMQGPTVVQPGALRLASYARPADVPEAGPLLFGFGEGSIWRPEPPALALDASGPPDALVGPAVGQPIDETVATAAGHLASAACPVMVHGYRDDAELHVANLCEGVAQGWTTVPLTLPSLPAGTRLGDGLAWGDANADGRDDLVVTTDARRIHVAYAVGDGTFHSDPATMPATEGDGLFDAGIGVPEASGISAGVVAVLDGNDDGRPDFITRSTWIRSCTVPECGTCDVPGYRCDLGPGVAPAYVGSPASVVDRDGDGEIELAVLAGSDDPLFALESWGAVVPAPGDLVVIDDPTAPAWSAKVIPLPGTPTLLASGDIDGDGADEVFLRRSTEDGDELLVVFGDDTVESLGDFERIVDAHVPGGRGTLAVVSEDLDGTSRRLTVLSATAEGQLRSAVKLALEVVPRAFVPGRYHPAAPDEIGLAVIGETAGGQTAVELLTRGGGTFFDASTRHATLTSLQLAPEHAASSRAVAVDLDDDGIDELVVFGRDGIIRTLRVGAGDGAPTLGLDPLGPALPEPYEGPAWPGDVRPSSWPRARDLDGDGDRDLWLLTAEQPPRLAAFENLGDGTLDVAGRSLSEIPPLELSICEDPDCTVLIRAFDAFPGPTDRSESVAPQAVDLLLVSRRALFAWTVDPFDPSTADARPVDELAVVRGGRLPLSPDGGQVLGEIGDIDGDGVADVVAGGRNGIRWLNGLPVIP